MTVSDIARRDVVTTDRDTAAPELAERMADEDVGSVVVTDGDRPVGLVTDRDLGLRVWGAEDPAAVSAADLMSDDLTTVDAATGIWDALRALNEADVRRLPVVTDGRLTGIVTLDDFLVLLVGELDLVSEVIQAESPPY